ncbi:MAG: DMT family transporter [Nitrososphaeraceae archaeon]|nr:DMT family transporter [Nitrososphaeraceae archaeon]
MLKGNFLTGALIPTQSTVDHIVAELFFVSLLLPSMVVVAAIAIPIAGAMLLAIHRFWLKKKITILRKEWKSLIIIAALFAATEFAWFDAVGRIGGSMTALLSVPLEPVAIIIMSFFILNEKLRKPQIIGSCVVIFGIILSLDMVGAVSMYQFGIGEIEAMMAAFTGATEVVLTVKFLSKYDEIECSAFILIMTGAMLTGVILANPSMLMGVHVTTDWFWLVLFPFVPMFSFLVYYRGSMRIGASFTSILSTGSIMLTLVLQVIMVYFGVSMTLPENMTFAVMGSIVSIVGIYIVFCKDIGRDKVESRQALNPSTTPSLLQT